MLGVSALTESESSEEESFSEESSLKEGVGVES